MPFQGGSPVVVSVDAPGQLHEMIAELAAALALPQFIFDIPNRAIDEPQFGYQGLQMFQRGNRFLLRCGQVREGESHVRQFGGIRDALALQFQDGDFVEEFSRGDFRGDGGDVRWLPWVHLKG
jgi:hypothetical protein